VEVGDDGHVYLLGCFGSDQLDLAGKTLNKKAGTGHDLFVAKFDNSGDLIWWDNYGGAVSYTNGSSLAIGGDGAIYLFGYFTSATIDFGGGPLANSQEGSADLYLAKLDKNGTHVWSQRFGGTGSDATHWRQSLELGPSGLVYVGAYFGSEFIDLGGGPLPSPLVGTGMILGVFESGGAHIWSRTFDGSGVLRTISVSSGGDIYGTGILSNGTVDFGGGPLDVFGDDDVFAFKLGVQ